MRILFALFAFSFALFAMGQNNQGGITPKNSSRNSKSSVPHTVVEEKNEWKVSYVEGDELLGTQADTIFYYEVKGVGKIMWGIHSRMFLQSYDGFFTYDDLSYATLTLGFYNKSNELVNKMTTKLLTLDDDHSFGRFMAGGDILDFLKDKSGTNDHVRIIASRYSKPLFDFTIPMMPDIAIDAASKKRPVKK